MGWARSGASGPEDGGRRPKRLQRYDTPGEKSRYFADDDAQDLAALIKRQKYEGTEDVDANLADNIMRKARYKCAPISFFSSLREGSSCRPVTSMLACSCPLSALTPSLAPFS
jgi:hypothetical protein